MLDARFCQKAIERKMNRWGEGTVNPKEGWMAVSVLERTQKTELNILFQIPEVCSSTVSDQSFHL